jgi:hypothetical protein
VNYSEWDIDGQRWPADPHFLEANNLNVSKFAKTLSRTNTMTAIVSKHDDKTGLKDGYEAANPYEMLRYAPRVTATKQLITSDPETTCVIDAEIAKGLGISEKTIHRADSTIQ